jgi:hypothetical protein
MAQMGYCKRPDLLTYVKQDEFEYPAIIDSCPPSWFLNPKPYSTGILEMRTIYFAAFY